MTWAGDYIGRTDMHCWGLVRAIYAKHCNVELPVYGEVDYRELNAVADAVASGTTVGPWVKVQKFPGDEQPFDVVVMRGWLRCKDGQMRRGIIHTGVITKRSRVLHTNVGYAVVEVALNHISDKNRLIGCYRHSSRV